MTEQSLPDNVTKSADGNGYFIKIETMEQLRDAIHDWHTNICLNLDTAIRDTESELEILYLEEDGKAVYKTASQEEQNAFRQGMAYALEQIAMWPFHVLPEGESPENIVIPNSGE